MVVLTFNIVNPNSGAGPRCDALCWPCDARSVTSLGPFRLLTRSGATDRPPPYGFTMLNVNTTFRLHSRTERDSTKHPETTPRRSVRLQRPRATRGPPALNIGKDRCGLQLLTLCWRSCDTNPLGGRRSRYQDRARRPGEPGQLTELAGQRPAASSQRGPATGHGYVAQLLQHKFRGRILLGIQLY
jgi:hypothetical protein